MAIRNVVTGGFGNGTFSGTIALVTLDGYLSGEEVAVALSEVQVRQVSLLLRDARINAPLRSRNVPGRNRTANVEF